MHGSALKLYLAAALTFALFTSSACDAPPRSSETSMTELAQADELAKSVVRQRGLQPASLSPKGVVSYGTLQFEYDAAGRQLVVSILTAEDQLWDQLGDEFKRNYLSSKRALSDPAIGGMFDSGGGSWRFEPDTGRTYLFRTYRLNTPPSQISSDLDAMANVVPAWTTRWSGAVAEIAQGIAPPPRSRVTLANDAYADRL